jgi:hypothetical protein
MESKGEIRLRISVVDPPPGITFAVQRGRRELLAPSSTTSSTSSRVISFDFVVRVDGFTRAGNPRFLGDYTQGPADERFIYVNSGTLAGQTESRFTRRAKIPLRGITQELIDQVLSSPNVRLEARFQGTGRDGGPACASTRLLGEGWTRSSD